MLGGGQTEAMGIAERAAQILAAKLPLDDPNKSQQISTNLNTATLFDLNK